MARRAAVRAARRALDAALTASTGGTGRAVRVVLPILLALLTVIGIVIVLSMIGALVGSEQSNASTCSTVSVMGPGAPPAKLIPIYEGAAARYALGPQGWAYLAAINRVETDFGQNLAVSSAGAIGWMQFEPSTWAKYGVDVTGGGAPDPYNANDAIYSAANMLHADGAPGDWSEAIYAYNHAGWYVSEVEQYADGYLGDSTTTGGGSCATAPTTSGPSGQIEANGTALAPALAPAAVQAVIAAGNQIIDKPYIYGGGHGQSLNEIAAGYDCSGSTSYVLYMAGLLGDSALVSGQFETYGEPGPGKWITIYANSGHVFIVVAGIVLNTAWYAPVQPDPPSSGPRWQPGSTVAAQIRGDTYGGFVVRHPTGL